MRKYLFALLLIALIPLSGWSIYKTYVLLVDLSNFPQDRFLVKTNPPTYRKFVDAGITVSTETYGQPCRLTDYRKDWNGRPLNNYAILRVTPTDTNENNIVSKILNQKWAYSIASFEVLQNSRRGTYVDAVYETKVDTWTTVYATTAVVKGVK